VPKAQREVAAAFFSDQELHEIGVTLQLRSSQKPNVNAVLTVNAFIDVSKVQFLPEATVNRSELVLVVGVFDQDGNPVKDFFKRIELHPNDEELKSLRQTGITADTEFEVPPGRYLVRALIRDDIGSSMGTRSLGVEVRPWR